MTGDCNISKYLSRSPPLPSNILHKVFEQRGWNYRKHLWVYIWWSYLNSLWPSDTIQWHLSQHWIRQWLGATRHQAITWTNVDLSTKVFCDTHLRTIPQELLTDLFCNVFGDYIFNIATTSPRCQWVKTPIFHHGNKVKVSQENYLYLVW